MLRVRLSARQNPDFPRRDDLPKPFTINVATLKEASEVCCRFIHEHALGGGNWSGGQVRDAATGKLVARISYNGRVWTPEPGPQGPRDQPSRPAR
jgi:hypothetical protein